MLQRILTGIPNKTYSVEMVQYLWKRALSENRSSKLRTELSANQGNSKCAKTNEKYNILGIQKYWNMKGMIYICEKLDEIFSNGNSISPF